MTAIDYAALGVKALQALTAAGVAATASRVKEGAPPDPVKPWRVAVSNPADPARRGTGRVFMSEYPPDQVDGNGVVAGDRKAVFAFDAGQAFRLAKGDLITLGNGERWGVVGGVAVPPEPLVVVWKLQVRRWPIRTTE